MVRELLWSVAQGVVKRLLLILILGLFQPTRGELMFDGLSVSDEEMRHGKATVHSFPSTIRLIDASIRENVALVAKSLNRSMTTRFGLR